MLQAGTLLHGLGHIVQFNSIVLDTGDSPLAPLGGGRPSSKPGERCFFTLRKTLTLKYRHLTKCPTSYTKG